MKLSKSLLSAIALGVTLTAVSSCSKDDLVEDLHFPHCSTQCDTVHEELLETTYNCPACGMG